MSKIQSSFFSTHLLLASCLLEKFKMNQFGILLSTNFMNSITLSLFFLGVSYFPYFSGFKMSLLLITI